MDILITNTVYLMWHTLPDIVIDIAGTPSLCFMIEFFCSKDVSLELVLCYASQCSTVFISSCVLLTKVYIHVIDPLSSKKLYHFCTGCCEVLGKSWHTGKFHFFAVVMFTYCIAWLILMHTYVCTHVVWGLKLYVQCNTDITNTAVTYIVSDIMQHRKMPHWIPHLLNLCFKTKFLSNTEISQN